jgi:hypothetical protein
MNNQKHVFINLPGRQIPHFHYEEYGIKGVGKNRFPIIPMDSFINHDNDLNLHIECCKGLALTNDLKMGMVYGSLPPEEVLNLGGKDGWTKILYNIEDYDPTGIHRQAIEEIIKITGNSAGQAIYKYIYFAMGSAIPWFFACYLKKTSFDEKTGDVGEWAENAKYFPNVIKYLESLPFKHIGRVLFFTSYPGSGVATHRDSIVTEHKDHNINLFFGGGWRPSFIWDEINKKKIFLESGARSYFFNNRDYHGVDPEPVFRYTLRVDGTFTDELCEKLGLEDGYTWKWDYEKSDKNT